MDKITESEIKEKLATNYGRGGHDRDLVKNERGDDHCESTGSVVYSLRGSPPKGYAIAIPELREVSFYNHRGKRFRHMTNTMVEELDDLTW